MFYPLNQKRMKKMIKSKTRRKNSRHRGSHTHGGGFKKKGRGKGNRGGIGLAGTGKRADHKKNLKLHPFGKDKTLRKKITPKLPTINLRDIVAKLKKGQTEVVLEGYKILGIGEIKTKLTIKASAASKSALDKIKKAGGDIMLTK